MQVSFNPLEPREANAVRILLGIPLDVPTVTVTVPDGSQPAPGALLASASGRVVTNPGPDAVLQSAQGITLAAAPGITLASEAASLPVPPAAPPKSHKKKAAAPVVVAPEQQANPAAPPAGTPSVGDLLANSTQSPAPPAADTVPPPPVPPAQQQQAAPAGAKPPTVEDVRAAYRGLFAVIGDEKGKEELRTVLAKAGSATVSDLKPEHFAAVVRSLNAATILAKAKAAPAPAAAVAKDPLL